MLGQGRKQKIEEPARSIPNTWKQWSTKFATCPEIHGQSEKRRQAVFRLAQSDPYAHRSHLPKYEGMRNSENGWSEEEAGMAQFDDVIGSVMKKLKDMGVDDNTIVVITTDNGPEVFTWPDGGQTPFAQSKGTVLEGGFRVPAILRWPGHVPAELNSKRDLLRPGLVADLRSGGG